MFDVGFWEVALIGVVALLVVGPEKLPGLARTVGMYVGKARRYADHVRREIEREVPTQAIRDAINNPPKPIADLKETLDETKTALTQSGQELTEAARELNTDVSATDAGSETDAKDDVSPDATPSAATDSATVPSIEAEAEPPAQAAADPDPAAPTR